MIRRGIARACVAMAVFVAARRGGAQTVAAVGATAEDRSERVLRATVMLTATGRPSARGVVLAPDGRIVTTLAALGAERVLQVRYPSGRVDLATVVARDEQWGVALLQPRAGHWRDGLPLASRARGNSPARWTAGDDPPRSVTGALRRRRTFVGAGGELLQDAWEFDSPPTADAVGSGVANAEGELVAVVVPPEPGPPAGGALQPFGVPVPVVRQLLASAGETAHPWLGLVVVDLRTADGAPGSAGLSVSEVTPGSPAERAGLRGGAHGDRLVAVDEHAVRSSADLAAALEGRHPGDRIIVHVLREGATVDLLVALTAFPGL